MEMVMDNPVYILATVEIAILLVSIFLLGRIK